MTTSIVSVFELSCQIQNSSSLYKNFFSVLNDFLKSKFNDCIFKRSKERLLLFFENENIQNTSFLGNFYTSQYMYTKSVSLSPSDIVKKINKVSKADLLKVAKKMFDKNIMVCETI